MENEKPDKKESPMMSAGEVAHEFGVDPKTVTRWAKAGKLKSVRTLGGHRRFRREDIDAFLGELQ